MADPHIPKSWREAKAIGSSRYFNGKPRKFGHIAEHYVSGGCVICSAAQGKVHRRDPVKRVLKYVRNKAHMKTPEALRVKRERRAAKRIALAGRPKPLNCEVCGGTCRIAFDHCHITGHFRGWLCERCNRLLGKVKDEAALLRKLADYLETATRKNAQVDFVLRLETERMLSKS